MILFYVSKPTSFLANCTTSLQFSSEKINANYEYDLELKLGLNFIAYTIESIYEFDPLITSYKPTKVKVTERKRYQFRYSMDCKVFLRYK